MSETMWGYGADSGYTAGVDLVGYRVEATDGHIGKVDKASEEVDGQYLVVDTGPWIFGKHVLLPAGTVSSIDANERTVYVSRTKDEIKNAPEYDKDKHAVDSGYHQQYGQYYGGHR
ncbi:PRC-barrel domain-containing protein [Streptacidiphilus sp. ASG 303]|uniref:PRC-barrel domain-containing protein n=1 Tax=Streptomycetaceae TaxID=2062 RepID=UPI001E324240|nr:PRC-barrel domain-containing protein [Streptacidiphilus sp. ASG 303]MCD0483623.1 PRC-barrel domain-containing protein [Streptacidiphilus sp. ASG 303]